MPLRRLTEYSIANAILVSLMAVCMLAGVMRMEAGFRDVLNPATGYKGPLPFPWLGTSYQFLLLGGAFLVALEVQLTRRISYNGLIFSPEWFRATFIEWVLLLFGLLLSVWIWRGPAFALSQLRVFPEEGLLIFTDSFYLEGLVAIIVSWIVSRMLVGELIVLEEPPPVPGKGERIRDPLQVQVSARDGLWQEIFVLGTLLILASVFGPAALSSLTGGAARFQPVGPEVFLYFLAALVLLSLGRLLMLRSDWTWERIPHSPRLTRRWILYSSVFFAGLILIAVLLPADFFAGNSLGVVLQGLSGGIFTGLGILLQGLSEGLMSLYALLIFPVVSIFFSLLHGITRWLGLGGGGPQTPESLTPPNLPSFSGGADIPVQQLAQGLLFWAVVLLILIFAFREVLRGRGALLRRMARWPFFRWLIGLTRGIGRRLADWRFALSEAVGDSFNSLVQEAARRTGRMPAGFLNIRALNSRDRVRFYFLSLVRRGTEQGLPRLPGQSPREYALHLAQTHAPLEPELREMVSSFEEARYTQHSIGGEQAHHVGEIWEFIRKRLRSARGKNSAEGRR